MAQHQGGQSCDQECSACFCVLPGNALRGSQGYRLNISNPGHQHSHNYGYQFIIKISDFCLENCPIIVADSTVIYEFAINPDKSHIIPENILYWVKFLTEIENNRLKFSACKGIMFDTNISYSETNESEMILGNKIAAYGDAKRYIDSFCKGDYALFYSKGRGIIAVGQIITDAPTEVADEKYHSVRMIVPENFNGDVKALPALFPNEIKTILNRNFYWASTIKTPFLTGAQVEMLIRELKKKHV